ncbi:MAG TPA: amidohydrolase family protein [Candidatus Methylomirabilis sp.]|nr:amidohydrolase family protein [Candidatus Methylomirabilis sp.]
MRWVLLRGGHIFDPMDRGVADLLILEGRIAAIGATLPVPQGVGEGEVLSLAGRVILPGLIDGHIHVMGASGTGGPTTRTTDLQIERITGAGVTTVVSPLGADSLSRTIPALLARAAALTLEGITAYCYTGGWRYPVPTLTGDPQSDVAFIDRVVGVKVAISEALAPVHSVEDLCRLAHAAYTGGRLAGKESVLHVHIGDLSEGLQPLLEVRRRSGIPADRMIATHVNRNPRLWKEALEYARGGGGIDLTGMQRPETGHPEALPAAAAIREALAAGIPPSRLTLSTDSGAAYPRYDAEGRAGGQYMAGPDSLLATMRELTRDGLTWGQAAAYATRHTADRLGLRLKGRLAEGCDADVLVLTSAGEVERVYARGRCLVEGGVPVVRGTFDGHVSI